LTSCLNVISYLFRNMRLTRQLSFMMTSVWFQIFNSRIRSLKGPLIMIYNNFNIPWTLLTITMKWRARIQSKRIYGQNTSSLTVLFIVKKNTMTKKSDDFILNIKPPPISPDDLINYWWPRRPLSKMAPNNEKTFNINPSTGTSALSNSYFNIRWHLLWKLTNSFSFRILILHFCYFLFLIYQLIHIALKGYFKNTIKGIII